MRLLVTGGAGFIGSNFVRYALNEQDYSVTTLDTLTYAGSKENLHGVIDHPNHDFVEGDIRVQALVESYLEDVDAILNFAAETHVDRSIENSKPFVETNIDGTRVLLDAARREDIQRFVQISTDEVYGEVVEGEFKESDPLDPRNPYSATKAGADHMVKSYYHTYDLPVLITRSSNNFGPFQHPEKLIPKFILRAAKGEQLPVYGDGSNIREWTYVKDNCRGIDYVLKEGKLGEVYNIGSGEELSNLEVTREIIRELDASQDLIEFVEDRPGHDQRYSLDTSKIRKLGWEPQTSFSDGLVKTINHYFE